MAIIGVSITKATSFRGAEQSFSNVYYYDGLLPNEAEAQTIINEVERIEKLFHDSTVKFREGRVWSAGGTIAQNTMILTTPLTGQGSVGGDASVDRERAVLIQWPAGVNVLGRPVYLRKWFHTMTAAGTTTQWLDGVKAQTTPIDQAIRTRFQGFADQLNPLNPATSFFYQLTSKNGRTSEPVSEAYPWLEHHQLGDEWR